MSCFPETSFLCAAYREQDNSGEADAILGSLPHASPVSPLVAFEFENSLRFHAGLFRCDRSKGFPARDATRALADFRTDISDGFWRIVPVDWAQVLAVAGKLSARHTTSHLARAMDLLHVATARHLGATRFLTFDRRQSTLAMSAGLKTPLRSR